MRTTRTGAVTAPSGASEPRIIDYVVYGWEWRVEPPGHPLDGHTFPSVPDAPEGIRCGRDAKLRPRADAIYRPLYEGTDENGRIRTWIGKPLEARP